ncbi:MAG: DUF2066 domain-containing protein [Alphaproteobacteria bacterium]|nr:DUF2066 domain-containing protein [Alphaproteobacteria bacterium]
MITSKKVLACGFVALAMMVLPPAAGAEDVIRDDVVQVTNIPPAEVTAKEKGASVIPESVEVAAPMEGQDPLTVTDVRVDKTAKDAVVARSLAIAAAKRAAFSKLAERNMTTDAFAAFDMPDDRAIAAVVQDFQIVSEQLSPTRYVANFTVRFRDTVTNYIDIDGFAHAASDTRTALVLPFLEISNGSMVLWEDTNYWLDAWQQSPLDVPGWNLVVPLGDITDITTGAPETTWRGDYTFLEAMRKKYETDDVALIVLNAEGVTLAVDVYLYSDGKLGTRAPLVSYGRAADNAGIAQQAQRLVAQYLKDRADERVQPVVQHSVRRVEQADDRLAVRAEAHFSDFGRWVDLQKRIAAATPPLAMELTSLNSGGAAFTLKCACDMAAMNVALADAGLHLQSAGVVVGDALSARETVYTLDILGD